MVVYSGGKGVNDVINSYPGLVISSGGTTSGDIIQSGNEVVVSGGIASGALVESSGYQYISAGGKAVSTTVNGGVQYVLSGGLSSATKITSGTEVVSALGTVKSGTIAGGVLDVVSGGVISGGVTFTGSGGQLTIESNIMPTNVISGFVTGDIIKLSAVAYDVSDTVKVNTAGSVTSSAGGSTYDVHIAGATVGSTAFVFGPGSLLTKGVGSAAIKFIAPAVAPAVSSGGTALAAPGFAQLWLGHASSVAAQTAPMFVSSAAPGGVFTSLVPVHHGGVVAPSHW
jgi:autotransporter passenger strand-loop-strand repeat protein